MSDRTADYRFDGKVVVITGGRGIGRALAVSRPRRAPGSPSPMSTSPAS
ncbi:hypothetical protein GXW82_09870 [Streptacidiphilus sp. 4-A2]|nr:hypothetical protein [Streptacidiphilus sp. 4-A2]